MIHQTNVAASLIHRLVSGSLASPASSLPHLFTGLAAISHKTCSVPDENDFRMVFDAAINKWGLMRALSSS